MPSPLFPIQFSEMPLSPKKKDKNWSPCFEFEMQPSIGTNAVYSHISWLKCFSNDWNTFDFNQKFYFDFHPKQPPQTDEVERNSLAARFRAARRDSQQSGSARNSLVHLLLWQFGRLHVSTERWQRSRFDSVQTGTQMSLRSSSLFDQLWWFRAGRRNADRTQSRKHGEIAWSQVFQFVFKIHFFKPILFFPRLAFPATQSMRKTHSPRNPWTSSVILFFSVKFWVNKSKN